MNTPPLVNLVEGGVAAEMVLVRPPRLLRGSLYLLALFLCAAVAWSYFSKVDIYIISHGVVRPKGDLVKVQAEMSGKLQFVGVVDGATVEEGQVLFRLDPLDQQTELASVRQQLGSQQESLAALVAAQQALMSQHVEEQHADNLAIESRKLQLTRMQNEERQAKALLVQAQARLDADRAVMARARELHAEGVHSGTKLEAAQLALAIAEAGLAGANAAAEVAAGNVTIAEQELLIQRNRLKINDSMRKRAKEEIGGRIITIEERAGVLAYSEKQLQAVLVRLEVRAPMDGTITSVLTKNIGEIVTPGTLLATLVPQGAELIVEANVTNRDAGPLRDRIGESVKLKFDAFPFRDFGTLNGTLVEVAHDAQPSENLGLVYRVAISFRPEPLSRGRQQGRVRLGMTVTGEIFKDRERVLMTLFRNLRDRVSVD